MEVPREQEMSRSGSVCLGTTLGKIKEGSTDREVVEGLRSPDHAEDYGCPNRDPGGKVSGQKDASREGSHSKHDGMQ